MVKVWSCGGAADLMVVVAAAVIDGDVLALRVGSSRDCYVSGV
jgi:hypothetical protein